MKLQRWRTFRHSDYVVKWQIAKLCSVDIMPHQLYNLLVSKTFLFCIHASKHAISILLILSKKKSLTNCVLSGTDEVDRGDKKINVEIIKSKCFQEVHVHIYFSTDISRLSGYPFNIQSRYSIWILKHYPLTAGYMCHVAFDIYVDDPKKTGHLFNLDQPWSYREGRCSVMSLMWQP